MNTLSRITIVTIGALGLTAALADVASAHMTGAIFTTTSQCTSVNQNIFDSKDDVYLNGGPQNSSGSPALPDGDYYVQVTSPSGNPVLGTSAGATVSVSGGVFVHCYQLSSILFKTSDGSPGYDDTDNGGGEYKVWLSHDSAFGNSHSKTDNFKVKPPSSQGTMNVIKFYDANANGVNDDNQDITNWRVSITHTDHDHVDHVRWTPVSMEVDPVSYLVSEGTPVETNWMQTTGASVTASVDAGGETDVAFGNLCLGGGGGHTLGFWSNKSGQASFGNGIALLTALNLRTSTGANFDPTSHSAFRKWVLEATATNMSYMLSAQLSAMVLNVQAGFVDSSAILYAPGTNSANALGYASVGALMAEADAALAANGVVLSTSPDRARYEAIKVAIDKANNNQNFVQGQPCPFSFAQ